MSVVSKLEVPIHLFSEGLTWEELFERKAPLKVEICSGKDEFIIRMGEQEPNTNFVGIERSLPISGKLIQKIERSGVENVRVIREDAHQVLVDCFKPAEIDKIFINFPDPWPKRRHHKRRLINPKFTQLMVQRLVPGGEIQFASDHRGYIDWALDHFEQNPNLENLYGKGEMRFEMEGYPPTIFMKKYIPEGRPFHFLLFKKKC